jgi:serine/threonine protein kinase
MNDQHESVKLTFRNNEDEEYEEIELLGVGVFGTTYKVNCAKNGASQVLKTIYNLDKDKSWENETRTLQSLNSSYIVKYFDAFLSNPFTCIVSELCQVNKIVLKFLIN